MDASKEDEIFIAEVERLLAAAQLVFATAKLERARNGCLSQRTKQALREIDKEMPELQQWALKLEGVRRWN